MQTTSIPCFQSLAAILNRGTVLQKYRNIDLGSGRPPRGHAGSGTKWSRVDHLNRLRIGLYCGKARVSPTINLNSFGGGSDVTLLRTILTVGDFTRRISVLGSRTTSTIIAVHPVEPLLIQHCVRRKACNIACRKHPFSEDFLLFNIDTSQSIGGRRQRDEL